MEFWVRSQDKKSMVQTNRLFINKNSMLDKELVEIVGAIGGVLGIYTEKRALEVLDEIQEAQLGNYHYRCPSNVKVSNNENMIVYEMPQY